MTEHYQALLALLERRPDLRSTQISDSLDIDPSVVNQLLEDGLARNEISKLMTTGPNGKTTLTFRRASATALNWVGATATAPATQPDTPPAAAVDAKKDIAPRPMKRELAIAFLSKTPQASAAALMSAIGVDPKYSPSQYLSPSLKSGEIVKDDTGHYRLGSTVKTAEPTAETKPASTVTISEEQPLEAIPDASTRKELTWSVFPDGELLIYQRFSATHNFELARLTPGDTANLFIYLSQTKNIWSTETKEPA